MKLRFILPFALVLALSTALMAKPAKRGPITIYQPDGSTFVASLRGDEFQHILVTMDGCAVVQDADGWYSYASFDAVGQRASSRVHVGSAPSSPAVAASRLIPYEMIRTKARVAREAAQFASPITKAATPVQKHGIVILAQYSDVKFTHTKQEFVNMLTKTGYSVNGATGCAKEYFDSQFNGMCDFSFDVTDIVTLAGTRATYGGNDSSGNDKNPEGMIIEACKAVDASIDFSLYDDDGDGQIDNVFLFFAGGDEAEYAGDDCVWSHAWYIVDGAGYNGVDRAYIKLDGKILNRYACTSECTTTDGRTYTQIAGIGTFCHEYSHTFGLPDFYDSDYETNGQGDGLWGSPSLMDYGSNNNGGNTPPYYNAIERELLGIQTPVALPEGNVTIKPISQGGQIYKINGTKDGEYYLLECRDNKGWDAYIGGEGLLVYHIDRSTNAVSVSVPNSSGKMVTENISAIDLWDVYNMVNAKSTHQCADILEANPSADGKHSSRSQSYSYKISDIFYPYSSYTSITPSTTQKLKMWSGTVLDIMINNIALSNGNITMSVIGDSSVEVPPSVRNAAVDRCQSSAIITFESSRAYEGEATVKYGTSGKTDTEIKVKPYENGCYAFRLDGLSPKTSYEVQIYFTLSDLDGERSSVKFMTTSIPEYGYPYIYLKSVSRNADSTFPSGSKFPLMIGGVLHSDVDGVVWYYDGKEITPGGNCYFTPTRSGELTAEIIYSDGAHDYVSKQITIK